MDTTFMASRRGMLTGTFGAIGATMLATVPAIAVSTPTPVMAAIAASKAAEARFNALNPDLECIDPAAHAREETVLSDMWDGIEEAEPTSWTDFVAQLEALTEDAVMHEDAQTLMVKRARRLLDTHI